MSILLNNVTDISNELISLFVKKGDVCADMTMGNGHDTKALLEKTGSTGLVYAFDVQEEAVRKTKELAGGAENARLILDSHENVDRYITEELDFAIYNLGYLPGFDRKIRTEADSTLKSLEKVLSLLKTGGRVIVTAYLGHEGGYSEYEAVLAFCEKLEKRKYNVLSLMHVNRRESAPRMIIIEKIRG